ncbi:MAG: ATP-binding domain-containing protein, partial [Deltaproteobacteria bacterium]|nr:ATP-binding domain-containing protein [Deltaproteobacteria bacterium]
GTSHAALRSAGTAAREAEGVGFGEIAVLYRLRAQRMLLEESFERAGIPYRTVGEEPLFLRGKGREVLRRLRDEPSGESATAVVRRLLASLGLSPGEPAASSWLAAAAAAGTVEALLERVALHRPEDDWEGRAQRVTLLTLHAAKGLEFDAVFVVGCEEGLVPFRKEDEDPECAVEEERRLFYVGMTRAREFLYLTRAGRRTLYGKTLAREPSRFLAGLADLLEETRLAAEAGPERPRQLRLL